MKQVVVRLYKDELSNGKPIKPIMVGRGCCEKCATDNLMNSLFYYPEFFQYSSIDSFVRDPRYTIHISTE
jgi:hypothetical protein